MSNSPQERTSLDTVAIRFAGDSGDGMQLTGTRFTQESARLGNDLATRPDFPAEIRAPAGTLAGVSAFQIHFGSQEIYTAGDQVDALVAMNPAALKANLKDLKQNGLLICNTDSFTEKNYKRVGYESHPLDDEELKTKYTLVDVAITTLTLEALQESPLIKSAKDKCKNFFALGIVSHIFGRSVSETLAWIEAKFARKEDVAEANKNALLGGVAYAEASEAIVSRYEVAPAKLTSGVYKNLSGNQGLAYGLVAAAERSGLPLFYSGYPITPASEILHELSRLKAHGVVTLQAEDEIAACGAALGAAYGGGLAVTASSGPGILLKQETIGLAVATELPLVIVNVQRGGPSTGLPTKTEQSDLLEVLYGRNGESPIPVFAISSPSDAFETTIQACKVAIEHMTPVFLLSDGYIGAGSEPWRIPDVAGLPKITPPFFESKEGATYQPYLRDERTDVRSWAVPGVAGAEHRIGGIEKQDVTGNISYDPANHQHMTDIRARKVEKIAEGMPPVTVEGDPDASLLVVSWGSTYGAVAGAVAEVCQKGIGAAHLHLKMMNPFPQDLEEVLARYETVLVPELNTGQLASLLKSRYLKPVVSFSKVEGQPFSIKQLVEEIESLVSSSKNHRQELRVV